MHIDWDRYEEHGIGGREATGLREEERKMHVQELKDRVARADYRVDVEAVANAIILKWRAMHVAPAGEPQGPRSGEVLEAD